MGENWGRGEKKKTTRTTKATTKQTERKTCPTVPFGSGKKCFLKKRLFLFFLFNIHLFIYFYLSTHVMSSSGLYNTVYIHCRTAIKKG